MSVSASKIFAFYYRFVGKNVDFRVSIKSLIVNFLAEIKMQKMSFDASSESIDEG